MNVKEIKVTDFSNIKIGNAQNEDWGTGCTVLICEQGAAAGLNVSGGGPASRESQLLNPLAAADAIHAVLLSGGSAFGLDAAGGVQQYLEERGIGFDVGVTKVPLVCESCLFDLTVKDWRSRPDKAMGYAACVNAEACGYQDGNYGAGTGATIGKLYGMDYCMKSGLGSYGIQSGELKIAALVAVNAFGDVWDWKTGRKLAGLLSEDKRSFRDTEEELLKQEYEFCSSYSKNTTLGVVITNAKFNKSQLCKIAGMAQDGYARSIHPVHTTLDGDSIYSLSVGSVKAELDLVGILSARVMSEAIKRAVTHARSAYGYPAWCDMEPAKL